MKSVAAATTRLILLCAGLCLAAPPVSIAAQDRPEDAAADTASLDVLSPEVSIRVIDAYNDSTVIRFRAPTSIPAGRTLTGDVAVLGGPVTLGGMIDGDLLIVNGDLRFEAGAQVTGSVLLVGGGVRGEDLAMVGDTLEVHPGALRYREVRGRLVLVDAPVLIWTGDGVRAAPPWGGSDFLITSGSSYNRIEGLPIIFGPRIQTAGSNPLRIQALGVYRTEAGLTLDLDDMGYYLRAEQFLGGHREMRIGVAAHSLIEPIEGWHLSDLENSLATFVFHRDYRDYYERVGYEAFFAVEPDREPWSLRMGLLWEDHSTARVNSPWSLLDNGEPWRPQPLAAEGKLTSLQIEANLDTRSTSFDPADGWLIRGRLERSLGSDLVRPAAEVPEPLVAPFPSREPREYGDFTAGVLDLRRYNRVDPASRLNFRLLVAGGLSGGQLPPQRQHAYGGEGSMPGFDLFSRDCGARDASYVLPGSEPTSPGGEARPLYYPAYGCDAMMLAQAEYRGKLAFHFDWASDRWDEPGDLGGFGWTFSPEWALFIDAGRGWGYDGRPDEGFDVDIGVGLILEPFGLYFATPVSGGGVNVFLRIGPRF